MSPISRRTLHLKKAREIKAQKLLAKKNDKKRKINEVINEMDQPKLDNTLDLITKLNSESKKDQQRIDLISSIQQLPDEEVKAANHLITTMRYPKGSNEGKLISPYLQNKAYEHISQSLYKHQRSINSLQETNNKMEAKIKQLQQKNDHLIRRTQSLGIHVRHLRNQKSKHISEIRSLVRQSHISDDTFKRKIKSIFKTNKREYSSSTIWLATSISQIGQLSMHSTVECIKLIYEYLIGEAPRNWLSTSTLRTWHQDVSNIYVSSQISKIAIAPTFSIMIDESTRGEIKNFVLCYQFWSQKDNAPIVTMSRLINIPKCNADTVSTTVINIINEDGLDIKKCSLWITDNTAYLSGDKKGAIVLFNKKTGLNVLRIGCTLHIIQIVLNHFEQEAFGKLSNTTGFSKIPHPYNLLYLAWRLHDGYNSSDKDKPLNINADIIRDLYDGLLGFHYNQYQLPLRSRWGYELRTAKQYQDRRESHIQFTRWFIDKMESCNTPKSYLNDWRLFESWINDAKLNIEIKCLINFAEHFYEPLMQFLVGQDSVPRIIQDDQLVLLPPGRRAHEMPDKVQEWMEYLKNIKDNFETFFSDELLDAVDSLSNDEFRNLFANLEKGITMALEYFTKWMSQWLHLPLIVCSLGGNNAQAFANSYRHIMLKKPWNQEPTDLELNYAHILQKDLDSGNINDFGLQNLLINDSKKFCEFEEFCTTNDPMLYNFPNIYEFVKTNIYYIVIHQQQVEGLFNKLDLKTHPNMSQSLKQSKLRLASDKIARKDLLDGLKNVRMQRNELKESSLQNIQPQPFGIEVASDLFNKLLGK